MSEHTVQKQPEMAFREDDDSFAECKSILRWLQQSFYSMPDQKDRSADVTECLRIKFSALSSSRLKFNFVPS